MTNQKIHDLLMKRSRCGLDRKETAELERLQTEAGSIKPAVSPEQLAKIKRRSAGVSEAAAMRELCQETIARLSEQSLDAVASFCEEMREFFGPGPKPQKTEAGVIPMTDGEAREFERRRIEYGEFNGTEYGDIPKKRLDYYLRKAEENARELARYLTNEKVAERLRQELEE